uniref:Uncharacterized protein n=1 Tax=Rhizophora mucronata TaxID=61149 RepID=A0A2P2JWQ9_RHIMU
MSHFLIHQFIVF